LFGDHDRLTAAAAKTSSVVAARVSPAARQQARARQTVEGEPVHGGTRIRAHVPRQLDGIGSRQSRRSFRNRAQIETPALCRSRRAGVHFAEICAAPRSTMSRQILDF
jgi:hypothetical protein